MEVEFVGVDVSNKGNLPAKEKVKMLQTWNHPKSPREIMSFIGFAIFYLRWVPYFEIKISPLRALIKEYKIDHKFKDNEFTDEAKNSFELIKETLITKPILQEAFLFKNRFLIYRFRFCAMSTR